MTPAQIEEARRWTALRGWRWMPGMVVVCEQRLRAMRICDLETLTERDVQRGMALAEALNAGDLWLPGSQHGATYEHQGKVGDVCGLVGIGHPVAYEEDDDGGLWPTFFKTSADKGWYPDVTDPATRGCLLALAREITQRPGLNAVDLGDSDWWCVMLEARASSESEVWLKACEHHEREAIRNPYGGSL